MKIANACVVFIVFSLNFLNGNSETISTSNSEEYFVFDVPSGCETKESAAYIEMNCNNIEITVNKFSDTILREFNSIRPVEVYQVQVVCQANASPYELLSQMHYNGTGLMLINCPFPTKGSFAPGWTNLKRFMMEQYKPMERTAYKPEFFEGMNDLLVLDLDPWLVENTTYRFTNDLYENMLELKELRVRDNQIQCGGLQNLKKLELLFLSLNIRGGTDELTLPDLKDLKMLNTLNYAQSNFGRFTKRFVERTPQITHLKLTDSKFESIDGDALESLTELYSFEFWGNTIDALPEKLFSNNKKLERVFFNFNKRLKTLPTRFLANLPKLWQVDITHNGELESLPTDFMQGSNRVSTLELTYNNLYVVPNDLMNGHTKLITVKLYGNNLELTRDYFVGLSTNVDLKL